MSRIDPTRTATLRRRFTAEIRRRFTAVRRAVVSLVEHQDAFGLRRRQQVLLRATRNEQHEPTSPAPRFDFLTTDQQRQAFEQWLAAEMQAEIVAPGGTAAWWDQYIQRAYKQGAGRAFDDVRKPAVQANPDFYAGSRDQFLQSAFGQPETREKLQLLTGRVFTALNGVTQHMATQLTRHLVDGLARGEHPSVMARRMSQEIDGLTKRRAELIAATEISRAHAEGQLDSLESMGVTEIGVAVEWATAAGACPQCSVMSGRVYKVTEARGMLPLHPRCRCAWIPYVGDLPGTKKQPAKQPERDETAAAPPQVKIPAKPIQPPPKRRPATRKKALPPKLTAEQANEIRFLAQYWVSGDPKRAAQVEQWIKERRDLQYVWKKITKTADGQRDLSGLLNRNQRIQAARTEGAAPLPNVSLKPAAPIRPQRAKTRQEWIDGLTRQERQAIDDWVFSSSDRPGVSYTTIRREAIEPGNQKKLVRDAYHHLQRAMAKAPKSEQPVLYRGLSNVSPEELKGLSKRGATLTMNAPSSFSADPKTAQAFTGGTNQGGNAVLLVVQKGRTGVDLQGVERHGSGEVEVLVPGNVKYKVVNRADTVVNGKKLTILTLEEI